VQQAIVYSQLYNILEIRVTCLSQQASGYVGNRLGMRLELAGL
jgi:hypothetical protein